MIHTEILAEPPFNFKEILRYASAKSGDDLTEKHMEECVEEIKNSLSYRVCSARFPIEKTGRGITFCGIKTDSKTLYSALKDCDEILLFAATVGVEIDRMILHYSRLSPVKALLFQAIGAERVESLCDAFCEDCQKKLSLEKKHLKPRLSPGYGDIPLLLQRDIFSVLDCPRKIGLTLNDNLLMTPTKSVTAIAGISKFPLQK